MRNAGRKMPPSAAKPPKPAPGGSPDAQALVAKLLLRGAARHGDPAMRAAGARLAKVAKG